MSDTTPTEMNAPAFYGFVQRGEHGADLYQVMNGGTPVAEETVAAYASTFPETIYFIGDTRVLAGAPTAGPDTTDTVEEDLPLSAETGALISRLDALTGEDPEVDHWAADAVLLDAVHPAVRAAYERLRGRAAWWAVS